MASICLAIVVGTVIGLAIIEFGDAILYRWRTGRLIWRDGPLPLPPPAVQALPITGDGSFYRLQLHPYIGFTGKPGQFMRNIVPREGFYDSWSEHFAEVLWPMIQVNNEGFWCVHDYPFDYDPTTTFVIGIFGGSVAMQFSLTMEGVVGEALKIVPEIADKQIVLLDFANGGAKQPQQLCALSYFLTIGQRLDFVLNLDGFNELLIGWWNLREDNTHIAMPLGRFINGIQSFSLVKPLFDKGEKIRRRLVALKAHHDKSRTALARMAYSFIVGLDRDRVGRIANQMLAAANEQKERLALPLPVVAGEVDYTTTVSRQWFNASVAMHNVARGFGIPYIHVLQPNQYFRSEQFTDAERAMFLDLEAPPLKEIVPQVYRAYLDHADGFRAQGVEFLDATGIFDGRNYFGDNVCHFNFKGNVLLAQAIGKRMRRVLGSGS